MPKDLTLPEAAALLPQVRRICVIGTSGGGKSTLSAALSARLDLPHIPMDRDIRWLPGWQVRPKAEQRTRLSALVATDRWIIDGTSVSSLDLRLPRTDLVIWMRPTRHTALWNLVRRVARHHGQTRPDMAEGCAEHLPDRAFLSYIWQFEQRESPRITAALATHGPTVPLLTLRGHRDTRDLLSRLA
ncbi:hypothetical protein [Sagittula sp. S175]|uniref:hypothetical protein n=1 Tax=Sagittula sp. S175 TaxID=3415129 RepID=UPI003C7B06A3